MERFGDTRDDVRFVPAEGSPSLKFCASSVRRSTCQCEVCKTRAVSDAADVGVILRSSIDWRLSTSGILKLADRRPMSGDVRPDCSLFPDGRLMGAVKMLWDIFMKPVGRPFELQYGQHGERCFPMVSEAEVALAGNNRS